MGDFITLNSTNEKTQKVLSDKSLKNRPKEKSFLDINKASKVNTTPKNIIDMQNKAFEDKKPKIFRSQQGNNVFVFDFKKTNIFDSEFGKVKKSSEFCKKIFEKHIYNSLENEHIYNIGIKQSPRKELKLSSNQKKIQFILKPKIALGLKKPQNLKHYSPYTTDYLTINNEIRSGRRQTYKSIDIKI